MATSFRLKFNVDNGDAVFELGDAGQSLSAAEIQIDRICDGCRRSRATAWHHFYPNGSPYIKCESDTPGNVALCTDCYNRANPTEMGITKDAAEAAEQKLDAALQPANRLRYERSDKWQAIRLRVLERDEATCRLCLSSPAAAIHHLTYANYGNELLYELVAACHKCHRDWHVNKDAYNRSRRAMILGKIKPRFPALATSTWRLSSRTAIPPGAKREATDTAAHSQSPKPLFLKEDIWYCDCQSIAYFAHDGQAKRHTVAKGCKQCGSFHKFGYFKRKPLCEPVEINERMLQFTNSRLDAFARNRFAEFFWHPVIQEAIESSWPCKCSRTRIVFRLCGAGVRHYGRQCTRCGIFRDAEEIATSRPKQSHAHDRSIALTFRRGQYRSYLDRLVNAEIEKLRLHKRSEAEQWLKSGASRMQLNLDRIKREPCFRCHSSQPLNVWFRVIPPSDYFNCLDLASFCDTCYSLSVVDFADKWNPALVSLPLHDHKSPDQFSFQQLTLF